MIFFAKHRLFFRAVSIFTLLGMLPSSVEAWHLLPQAPQPIWEIDLDTLIKMDELEGVAPEDSPYVLLAQNELESRRSDLLAKNTPPESPSSSPLDKLKDTTKFFSEVTLGALEQPETEIKRYQVAEVLISREEVATSRGPSGGSEAASRLESAIQQYEVRNYADSAGAFMRVINDYPGSHEALAANEYFLNIMKQYVAGRISEEVLTQIEQNLPAVESLTVEGKYARLDFYTTGLETAMLAKNIPAQKRFIAGAESGARNFLETHPTSGLSHSTVLYLYDVALARDAIEIAEYQEGYSTPDWNKNNMALLAEYLRGVVEPMEASPGRMAVYDVLGQIVEGRNPDMGERMKYRFALTQEAGRPWFTGMLEDPNVYYWVKGRFIYALAYALNDLGEHDAAAEWLDFGINLSTRKSATTYELLVFERARTTHLQHRFEVDGANEALWDFVEANPNSIHTPVALTLLGSIYMTAGDYNGAATIYSQIIETYPDSHHADQAERDRAFIGAHLLESLPALADGKAPVQTAEAQWCGPHALHNLLASVNIFAPARELAELAGTDESGTTMLGLREAASAKGVELSGIKANTIDAVPLPAIAYLDGHHFVMVSAVGADTLTVHDGEKPAQTMTRFEFARRWRGEALIVTPPKQLAQVFSEAELEARKGGGGSGPGADNTTTQTSAGGSNNSGNAGDTAGVGCATGIDGDTASPPSYTSIHTPGVNLTIQSFRMAPMLSETDLSMPVQSGDVPMSFQRYYTQDNYRHRINNSSSTYPWNNNIGASWSHNYNIYLDDIYPVEEGEGAVVFYDANSVPRMYYYEHTASGKEHYYRTGGHSAEYGVELLRDTTTGKFTMYFPSGRTLYFTTSASFGHARLEKMVDLSGNEVTLAYDNTNVGTGRLTKVTEPSGRYTLQMSYSGTAKQITKVELKDGATVLQSHGYAYKTGYTTIGAVQDLTKATDNNGAYVQYGYAAMQFDHDDCLHDIGYLLTKITDKMGCETTLVQDWPDVEDSSDPEPLHPTYLEIINDEGMKLRYVRGGGGVMTITNESWNGSAWVAFRKLVNTPVTNDPSRGRYVDYYYDATNYNRWETQWNAIGLMTKELQPGGVVEKQLTYNALGRISTATSGSATPTTTYHYDASGLFPTKITGGDGTETTLFYDAYYRVTKQVHPAEPDGQYYFYSPEGFMTKHTNALGHDTTYAFDDQGRQTAVTNALSQTSYTEYDDYGKATKTTNADGKHSYSFYNDSPCFSCGGSQGQLTKTTDTLGNDTFFYYDANSRMTKTKNALNQETDFVYDCLGRRVTTTFPSGSGNHMITEYDLLGLATKTIDLAGNQTLNYYDERGRVTKSTYPVIGDVKYFYDATGLKTKVTDALNHNTEYFFDYTRHVLTRTLDAVGKELKYYYDAAGRVTKTGAGSSGDIMPTLNYYDGATGMMTKVRHTDAASATSDVQYYFNKARQMTKLTDWTGDLEYRYSNVGQLTKLIDYDDANLIYAYDNVGRVTSMTDYHGAETEYEYDDGGRLTLLTAPGSKVWEFVYNDLGQPIETYNPYGSASKSMAFQCNLPGGEGNKVNPDGTVQTFGYDSRNRLTRIYLGTEATAGTDLEEFLYELDAVGNITKTTELDGTEWVYAYDNRYRLTSAIAAEGTKKKWKETYVYDNGDNLLTKRVPFSDNFDDLDDDLEYNGDASYVATKGYMEKESGSPDAGNCRLQPEHDFHMWFSYLHGGTYEGQIRIRESGAGHLRVAVTSSTLVLRSGSTVLDTETVSTPTGVWYEYYAKADGANVEIWRRKKGTTDAMVKVLETTSTTVTAAGYFTFATGTGNYLDDVVVLKLDGDTVKTETQAYNAANEMTSQVADGATTNFAYDQFGRMTAKTRGGYTGTFYYNYGDKLTKVASNFQGEGTVSYTYSGDQKRRSRSVSGGAMTKYRVDQGFGVVNEENSGGTLLSTYVHHPGRQIGTVLATSEGSTASSGTWNYYFQDAIGSTRSLWDEDGDRLGKYDYTPFGGKYGNTGEEITRKFTGHDWDSTARLYHTAYRNYSPDIGRWLTRDPLGMHDGPNIYAYVQGNPVSMVDALGLFGTTEVNASSGIVGNLVKIGMAYGAGESLLFDLATGELNWGSLGRAFCGALGGGITGAIPKLGAATGTVSSAISCFCNSFIECPRGKGLWERTKGCFAEVAISGALGGAMSFHGASRIDAWGGTLEESEAAAWMMGFVFGGVGGNIYQVFGDDIDPIFSGLF